MADRGIVAKLKLDIKDLEKKMGRAQKLIKVQGKQLEKMGETGSKAFKQVSDTSGLAGASLMALGGGLSDMQYGLRGVANNAQQFVAMMGMLTTQAGGMKGALRALGAQMLGPMGIVVGLQTAISLFGMWQERQRKAAKEAKELAGRTSTLSAELRSAAWVVQDGNQSLQTRERAYDSLQKQLPELTGLTMDQAIAEGKLNKAVNRGIQLSIAKARAEKMMPELLDAEDRADAADEELAKRMRITADLRSALSINRANESIALNLARATQSEQSAREEAKEATSELVRITSELTDLRALEFSFTEKTTKELKKQERTFKNMNRTILESKGAKMPGASPMGGPTAPSSFGFLDMSHLQEGASSPIQLLMEDLMGLEKQMQQMAAGAINEMATALGDLFSKDSEIQGFGDKMKAAFADLVATLGKLFVALGVPMLAVPGEQARGLALIAGGIAAQVAARAVGGSIGGGGGGTMGTPNSGIGGGGTLQSQVAIRGEDLYIALERVNTRKGRRR